MKRRLLIELSHFKQLPSAARVLLVSSVIYESASPLLFVFLNAYLFRNTGNFTATVLYHLGMFLALPVTFYINGWLLKKIPIPWLLTVGLIGQGIVASMVFFLRSFSLDVIFTMGAFQGIAMGFYWSNRNFMNLTVTKDEERDYFTGLEMIIASASGVAAPFITGWAIVLGVRYTEFSIQQTYQLLAVIAMLFLVIAGKIVFQARVSNPKFKKLWLGIINSPWNMARVREILFGVGHGLEIFVPASLTLLALGQEGMLGTLQSSAAIIGSALMYVVARKVRAHRRKSLLLVAVIFNIAIIFPLSLFFNTWAIVLYLMGNGLAVRLTWMALNPTQQRVIDEEEGGDSTNNYAYVCDREMFLNIGRVLGILIFLPLMLFISQETALRVGLLLVGLLQFGLVWAL